LLPYRADTILFVDPAAYAMLVIDPHLPAWLPEVTLRDSDAIETIDERKKIIPVDDDRPLNMRNLCHSTEKCPLRVPLHPGAAKYYREKGYLK
jgi:hypothetical protein